MVKKFRQEITFEEMTKEIARELGVRKRVYPRWIEQEKITQETADFRCLVFEAIAFHLYKEMKKCEPQQGFTFQNE